MSDDQVKIKKVQSSETHLSCGDGYPYGTSLTLEDELIDDLGIGGLVVGDVVEIRAYAVVSSVSEHASKDHSNKSTSLQLTSLKVDREKDDRVKVMYGE